MLHPCIVHNFYRSSRPSGENSVVEREKQLLIGAGIRFSTLERHSDDLLAASPLAKLKTMMQLPGSRKRCTRLKAGLKELGCDLIHLHNPWPLLSYDIARAALELKIPLIQTLHNYRLLATDYCFADQSGLRTPRNTEEVEHLNRMPALHGSLIRNWAYARALKHVWHEGLPQRLHFICLTTFQQQLLLNAGIAIEQTIVKPNCLDHKGPVGKMAGEFVLFVGRLSSEKGIRGLAKAWPKAGLPLKVVGNGPDAAALADRKHIEYLGPLPHRKVQELMAQARLLVMNSTWYEGFPLVLVEALAAGTPCLVPSLGGMPDIIPHGLLGRTFKAEDGDDLVLHAKQLWEEAPTMRSACRAEFEMKYTPERNLNMLLNIYDNLIVGRPLSTGVTDK